MFGKLVITSSQLEDILEEEPTDDLKVDFTEDAFHYGSETGTCKRKFPVQLGFREMKNTSRNNIGPYEFNKPARIIDSVYLDIDEWDLAYGIQVRNSRNILETDFMVEDWKLLTPEFRRSFLRWKRQTQKGISYMKRICGIGNPDTNIAPISKLQLDQVLVENRLHKTIQTLFEKVNYTKDIYIKRRVCLPIEPSSHKDLIEIKNYLDLVPPEIPPASDITDWNEFLVRPRFYFNLRKRIQPRSQYITPKVEIIENVEEKALHYILNRMKKVSLKKKRPPSMPLNEQDLLFPLVVTEKVGDAKKMEFDEIFEDDMVSQFDLEISQHDSESRILVNEMISRAPPKGKKRDREETQYDLTTEHFVPPKRRIGQGSEYRTPCLKGKRLAKILANDLSLDYDYVGLDGTADTYKKIGCELGPNLFNNYKSKVELIETYDDLEIDEIDFTGHLYEENRAPQWSATHKLDKVKGYEEASIIEENLVETEILSDTSEIESLTFSEEDFLENLQQVVREGSSIRSSIHEFAESFASESSESGKISRSSSIVALPDDEVFEIEDSENEPDSEVPQARGPLESFSGIGRFAKITPNVTMNNIHKLVSERSLASGSIVELEEDGVLEAWRGTNIPTIREALQNMELKEEPIIMPNGIDLDGISKTHSDLNLFDSALAADMNEDVLSRQKLHLALLFKKYNVSKGTDAMEDQVDFNYYPFAREVRKTFRYYDFVGLYYETDETRFQIKLEF